MLPPSSRVSRTIYRPPSAQIVLPVQVPHYQVQQSHFRTICRQWVSPWCVPMIQLLVHFLDDAPLVPAWVPYFFELKKSLRNLINNSFALCFLFREIWGAGGGSIPPPPSPLGRGVDAVDYSADALVDDLFHRHYYHQRHFSFVRCGDLP